MENNAWKNTTICQGKASFVHILNPIRIISMNLDGHQNKQDSHRLPLLLTLIFLFAIIPALFLLESFPVGGRTIDREDLNLTFGLLSVTTLLLAGVTVSMWPPNQTPSEPNRTFPKDYRILPPISIVQDRKKHGTRSSRKSKKKSAPEPQPPEPKPIAQSVAFQEWAGLPLFPREGSEHTDSLIDLASNGLLFIDNSGTILAVNQSAEGMFGSSLKELKGRPVTDTLPKLFPDTDEPGDLFEKFSFKGSGSEVFGIRRETFYLDAKGNQSPIMIRMSKQEAHGELVIAIEAIPN